MSEEREEGMVAGDGAVVTRAELRSRISVVAPGIVLTRDLPKHSPETWLFMAEHCQEVGEQFDAYVMILDLSEAGQRPKGAYKEAIKHSLDNILEPVHMAFVQPSSALLRSVLRFITSAWLAGSSSVHPTLEEALTESRKQLAAHAQA
jgi:hypothetical protein